MNMHAEVYVNGHLAGILEAISNPHEQTLIADVVLAESGDGQGPHRERDVVVPMSECDDDPWTLVGRVLQRWPSQRKP